MIVDAIIHFFYRIFWFLTSSLEDLTWKIKSLTSNPTPCTDEHERHDDDSLAPTETTVSSILTRHKLGIYARARHDDFITYARRPISTRRLLDDDYHLYCFSPTHALFVQVPAGAAGSGVDVYASDASPFLYIALFKYARRVARVSHATFERLAAVSRACSAAEQATIITVSNTGRCGSTLLAQLFESRADTRMISEPDGMSSLLELYNGGLITRRTHDHLLPMALTVTCKPPSPRRVQRDTPSVYCVKLRNFSVSQMDVIAVRMPEVRHLFLYRNPRQTIDSMNSAFMRAWLIRYYVDNQAMQLFRHYLLDFHTRHPWAETHSERVTTRQAKWALCWAFLCAEYLRLRHANVGIAAVRYRQLVEEPERCYCSIMQHCGIPCDQKVNVTEVLARDSQRGLSLSGKITKTKNNKQEPRSSKAKIEETWVIERFGFSLKDDGDIEDLEGTL